MSIKKKRKSTDALQEEVRVRERPFYLVATMMVDSIDAVQAHVEIYLKFFWPFAEFEAGLEEKTVAMAKVDDDGTERDETLTEEMKTALKSAKDNGEASTRMVYGALPVHGESASRELFHVQLPVNPQKPFLNQKGNIKHITMCWTAFNVKHKAIKCQMHFHATLKVANPDLCNYPFDRCVPRPHRV